MKTYSEQEVKDLMYSAWWSGHEESRYSPNLHESALSDILKLIREHNEPDENEIYHGN